MRKEPAGSWLGAAVFVALASSASAETYYVEDPQAVVRFKE